MTFGVCAGIEEATAVLDAGFDYVEVGASNFNGLEPNWDPSRFSGLPIPATNLFFDSRIHLFGRTRTPYQPYARRTIERAASLGVRTMVVGSGKSRNSPDHFDGYTAFVEMMAELQAIATPLGITIAPESLNADETNVGVHLGRFAWDLHRVGVGFTADSYHILREWDRAGRPNSLDDRQESLENYWSGEIISTPTHVHVGPIDRTAPRTDDPMLRSFAKFLKEEMVYDGAVSLEVNRGPDFDLAAANLALRELFA